MIIGILHLTFTKFVYLDSIAATDDLISCYQHFPINGQDIQASSSNVGDLSNAAVNLLRGKLGGSNDDWQVGQQDLWGPSYTAVSDLYTHVYFRQLIVCPSTFLLIPHS